MRLLLALFRSGFYELWYSRNVRNDRISETDIAFLWSNYGNDKLSVCCAMRTEPGDGPSDEAHFRMSEDKSKCISSHQNRPIVRVELFIHKAFC